MPSFIPVFLASNAHETRADAPANYINKSAIQQKYVRGQKKCAHCWDSVLFPVIAPACNQVERCRSTMLRTVGESGGGDANNQTTFIGAWQADSEKRKTGLRWPG